MYAAGGASGGSAVIWKTNADDGKRDEAFGLADRDVGSNATFADIAKVGRALFGTALDRSASSRPLQLEKRSADTNALIETFGDGGAITSSSYFRVVADDHGLYVNGGTTRQFQIEKRSLEDGALDPSFGNGGYYTSAAPGRRMRLVLSNRKSRSLIRSWVQIPVCCQNRTAKAPSLLGANPGSLPSTDQGAKDARGCSDLLS